MGATSSNKLETSESIRTIRAFQNGGAQLGKVHVERRRLHVQIRPQGCLFFSSSPQGITEICKIRMGREPLRIHVPLFWSRSSTSGVYKALEGSYGSPPQAQYSNNYIHRQHVDYRPDKGRYSHRKGHSNLSTAEPRIFIQSKEIGSIPLSGDRILGNEHQFEFINSQPSCRQSEKSSKHMQGNVPEEVYFDFRIDETSRPFDLDNTSSVAGSSTNSKSATITNKGSKIEEVFSEHSEVNSLGQGGTSVVDREPSPVQWEGINSKTLSPSFNSNRCLNERLGAVCRGIRTGGQWCQEERGMHINILELLAVKLALLTFIKTNNIKSIHFQIDNKTAISYLLKMGGTKSQSMIKISKEIWDILFKKNITISAEYLPSALNQEADWESRHHKDSSDWKLCPLTFHQIGCQMGHPSIDLFASRLCHQLDNYLSWKPDPYSKGVDAMQHIWSSQLGHILYAFPPYSLIPRVLHKVIQDQVHTLILIAPVWQAQPWYPSLLQLSVKNPILLPQSQSLLSSPTGEVQPLLQNQTLRLAAWKISNLNPYLIQGYQNRLPSLSVTHADQNRILITTRPGENGLAGVLRNKLIQFNVL